MLRKFKPFNKWFFKRKVIFPRRVERFGEDVFVIREVLAEDVKRLLEVERLVYGDNIPWTRSAFLSELLSPIKHLYLCVEQEGAILAFIGCRIIGNDAHITNLAVVPNVQGRGIGNYLVAQMIAYAQKNDCLTLSLEVRLGNIDAQRLYRNQGFVSKAIKRGYYDATNEDALDMVKYLED
ncbi:MAG: ribosomal protein S18-alanine N-acetyltransferase [Enterococcus sp.]